MDSITMSEKWFRENVSENIPEITKIMELTNKFLSDHFNMNINKVETTAAMYTKILETICDVIVEKESEYDSFNLNVADRFNIGYTTTDNEDDEKNGNFMVYMTNIENHSNDITIDDEDDKDTITLRTEWNAANIKTQSDIIKEISSKSKATLGDFLNIATQSTEFIMPIFCITHSHILKFIKQQRIEKGLKEYELNICGMYIIGVQETDDAVEEVYYVPGIPMKLRFKNDQMATGY